MKKILTLALVAAMTLSLVACSSSSSTETTTTTDATSEAVTDAIETAVESGEGLNIAFFTFENSNTFTTYIRKGIENYGAQFGITVDNFDGKSDQAVQTDAIAVALQKGGYDILVVNPVDSGAGTTINAMCAEYGVPVIYVDRAPDLVGGVLDEYDDAYYVGLGWSSPGQIQADAVYEAWTTNMEAMDKNGDGVLQYVILQGNIAQQNAIYRTEAIQTSFAAWDADGTMPNEMLDIQDGNWSADQGTQVMDVWNVRFGDEIEVVMCNNDAMATGAVESIKITGAYEDGTAPMVYGINAIPDVWDLIEDGYMEGSVLTSPYQEAICVVQMAMNICAGNDPLEGTDWVWGEYGKDVRMSDQAVTVDNLEIAMEDYNACM